MLQIIFESEKLRNQFPLTDEQLMVQLDRIGMRPYQFDLGQNNEIILRLSYELLRMMVEIQKVTPLEVAPVRGTARGRRGRVLTS